MPAVVLVMAGRLCLASSARMWIFPGESKSWRPACKPLREASTHFSASAIALQDLRKDGLDPRRRKRTAERCEAAGGRGCRPPEFSSPGYSAQNQCSRNSAPRFAAAENRRFDGFFEHGWSTILLGGLIVMSTGSWRFFSWPALYGRSQYRGAKTLGGVI
jgi:hypothetical protein